MKLIIVLRLIELLSSSRKKTKIGVETNCPVPEQIKREAEIGERVSMGIDDVESLGGERSLYSCPECGGALWEIHDREVTRFRCYTGHIYTSDEVLDSKRKELEDTFWVALRIL